MMTAHSAPMNHFHDFDMYQIIENESVNIHLKGTNKQQFLIIFRSPAAEEKELIPYLQKILSAISIQLEEDTLYLNLPDGKELCISHLIKTHGISKILVFAIQPKLLCLNLQITEHRVFSFLGSKWLWAESLSAIFSERTEKNRPKAGALWTGLKELLKD
jgi:hypothetical protein